MKVWTYKQKTLYYILAFNLTWLEGTIKDFLPLNLKTQFYTNDFPATYFSSIELLKISYPMWLQ